MANKDVNLVIRAKNEASKSLNEVQSALDALKRAQDGVATSADKADKSLAGLADEQERLKTIKAASDELAKAKVRLDTAAGAADRLKAALGDANTKLSTLRDDASSAAQALAVLNTKSAELAAKQASEKQTLDAANASLTRQSTLMKELAAAKREASSALKKSNGKNASAADIEAAISAQGRVTSAESAIASARAGQEAAKSALSATTAEMRALNSEISVLTNTERSLSVEIANTEGRITNLTADVTQAVTMHRELASAVQMSSTELAQFSAQVGRSSGNLTGSIEKIGSLMQTIGRYSTGGGQFTDPKNAAAMQSLHASLRRSEADVQTLEQAMSELDAEMARSATITRSMTESQQRVAGALEQARAEMTRNKSALDNYATGGESAKDALIRLNRESRQAMSVAQRLRGEILSMVTAYVGLYGAVNNVAAVLRNVGTMQGAQTRLSVVFEGDPKAAGQEMLWLQAQAARLGIEFGTLAEQYTKFAVSAQEAKFATSDMRKVFLALAEAGRVNKLSMDDMNGIFLALTQMIQKGKVSAEELRGQMAERLPGAVTMMARAFGYGADQLDDFYKAMAGGNLDVNAEVMGKFADELNAKFGSQLQASLQLTNAQIGRFFNNLYNASLQFANGGFLDAFNDALARMNAWFESKAGHEFFLGMGAAAQNAYHLTLGFVDLLGDFKILIYGILALKASEWVVGLGTSFFKSTNLIKTFRAELQVADASMLSFRTKMSALGSSFVGLTAGFTRSEVSAGAFASRLTLAGASATAAATGMGILRTSVAMLNTAAAAMGGWIPLLITAGITLATPFIADWVTGVDDATSAMDEHDRIMTSVLSKYDQLKNKAQGWADVVESVTVDQADANLLDLLKEYDKALRSFSADSVDPFSNAADAPAVFNAGSDLYNGNINLQKYIGLLQKAYSVETDVASKEIINEYLEKARAVQALGDKTALAGEVAQRFGSVLTNEVARALGLSGDRLKDVAESADDTTKAVERALTPQEKYIAALQAMMGEVPALAGELKKFKDATDLSTSAWNAFIAAVKTGDLSNIANVGKMFWSGISGIFGGKGGFGQTNWEAVYTAGRFGASGGQQSELVAATTKLAEQLGVSAKDLLTAMSFETGGTFDPSKMGGAGGKYLGLIQFSPDQQKKYGLTQQSSVTDQVVAAGQYLSAAGVKPGDGLAQIYAAILSGNAANLNASDIGNGGVVANVLDATSGEQFAGHKARADGLLAAYAGVSTEAQAAYEADKKAAEEARKKTEELAKQKADNEAALAALGVENDIIQMKNSGLDREAFIEEKLNALRESNKGMTEEQLASAKELLGTQYDLTKATEGEKGAKKEIEAVEKRLSDLQAQKSSLGDMRDTYAARGDMSNVAAMESQIDGVNRQMIDAIGEAETLYRTLGGEGADAAIAKLEAMKLSLQSGADASKQFRFSMEEVRSTVFDSLEGGIVDVFKSFAEAIATGEDAVKSLGKAFQQFAANFLMEMAQMILKQALFNAISGLTNSISGGLGSFMGLHSGGIVGASTGSGDIVASPAWFQNAMRYHTGGIVGLQPNEVPAILQAGEEVLTANDPNHSRNRGSGGAGKSVKVVNMFDAGSFVSEALKSTAGEEAILNHVRANPAAWRSAMEG